MSKTVGALPSTELLLDRPERLRPGLASEALRVATVTGAGALALFGLARGGWLGLSAVALGGALFSQRRRLFRRPYTKQYQVARAAVTVLTEPQRLQEWLAIDQWPRLFSFVASVEPVGERVVAIELLTGGAPLTWEVEIANRDPHRLVWRATADSEVPGDGEILLTPAPGDKGTEVHVRLLLGPPAAWIGAIAAGKVGRSGEPGIALRDDLRRLKQVIETGEVATTHGQPRGGGRNTLRERTALVVPQGRVAMTGEEVVP